jgi:ABC-type phosphate transport system permease subunit
MAAKKNKKVSILNKEMDPMTESIALGSAFSVLFLMLVKSLVIAVPLGLALAFAHHYGRSKAKKKK